MSDKIVESVEALADRLAAKVAETVDQKIIDKVTEAISLVDRTSAVAERILADKAPEPKTNVKQRGRKPTPADQKKLCSKGDGVQVLAKGLCRKHYYQNRRKVNLAKEATTNGGGTASAS